MIANALTVDVEDYFQVSAFEGSIDRQQWDQIPQRVERNTNRLIEMFAENDTKATFFTLGWIAERFPQLIQRIVAEGHELASHGYDHERVFNFDRETFRADITKTKNILEDVGGCRVRGYRAPSFSISAQNLWALEVLEEAGYNYSSSIYPIHHDHYSFPDAPRFEFQYQGSGIKEIPISTARFFSRNWPCGGGGFFRLYPYPLTKWLLQKINDDNSPCVFYLHPWEIDHDQPRQAGLPWRTKFRHYLNLGRMEGRLRVLLNDFKWSRMDHIFLPDAGASAESHARVQ